MPSTPKFNDTWRSWIAEQVILDTPGPEITAALLSVGFSATEVQSEVHRAIQSPYTRGAERLQNRAKKLEWLLGVHHRLRENSSGHRTVPVRDRLPAHEFLKAHYVANWPVLLKGMLDDWPAMHRWSPSYFKQRFGNETVEVQMDRNSNKRYELQCDTHRRKTRMAEFVDLVASAGKTNDFYMTARNGPINQAALSSLWRDIGTCPDYLDALAPGTAFLWFGPAGTCTPLHHDYTNNFFAQIHGRKRIILIPPYDTPLVYNTSSCFSAVNCENVDNKRYPKYRKAHKLICDVGPGDALFIPIGWWHHVNSLSVSISVTLTNFAVNNDFEAAEAPSGKL